MNMLKRAAIHKSGQGSDKVVKKGHRVAYAVPPFHNWQYLSMRVAAKKAYTSLRILLVYECNANVVYFDGAQLFNTCGPWGESWA